MVVAHFFFVDFRYFPIRPVSFFVREFVYRFKFVPVVRFILWIGALLRLVVPHRLHASRHACGAEQS